MKNNTLILKRQQWCKRFKSVLLGTALIGATPAYGQSIAVGELGSANAYEAGIIDNGSGGLDAALWQQTSAARAAALISQAPLDSPHQIVRDLVSAAILSAGVPPNGDEDDLTLYREARVKAALRLGSPDEIDDLLRRAPQLTQSRLTEVDIAFAREDILQACKLVDGVQEGRAEPDWVKRRAFCHITRGESAAAELSINLLKESGHKDKPYFALADNLLGVSDNRPQNIDLDQPLFSAMRTQLNVMAQKDGQATGQIDLETLSRSGLASLALDSEVDDSQRLAALYKGGQALSDDQISTILSDFAFGDDDLQALAGFDLESALTVSAPKALGQLHALARAGNISPQTGKAIKEMLARANTAGAFDRFAKLLEPQILLLSGETQAKESVILFARAAVNRGDIGTLQALYHGTPDDARTRAIIALTSDALGNGFLQGSLGKDIETRLGETGAQKSRAIRDSYIALALGSRLSDSAVKVIETSGAGTGKSVPYGSLVALRTSANAASRAETALRAAILLGKSGATGLDDASLAEIIAALNIAGLTEFAGRLAAEDFLSQL